MSSIHELSIPTLGQGIVRYVSPVKNLAATGTVQLVPTASGRRFAPIAAYMRVLSKSGTLTTGPSVRIGNDASHVNVAPLLASANTSVTETLVSIPLVTGASLATIALDTAAILAEVQTQGSGAGLAMTGEFHLWGFLL